MKKTILVLMASVAMAFGMISCMTQSAVVAMSDGTAINAANFTYVGTVKAEAQTSTWFMLFGGGNADQRVLDELKRKANLKDGQMLTNIRITAENEYIVGGIVIKKTVRGTADVVQFK